MIQEEQKKSDTALGLVKAFFAAKERHDLAATMALFSEDAVYIFPWLRRGNRRTGSPIRAKKP